MSHELISFVVHASSMALETSCFVEGISVRCEDDQGIARLFDGEGPDGGIDRGAWWCPEKDQRVYSFPGPLFFGQGAWIEFEGALTEAILFCTQSDA